MDSQEVNISKIPTAMNFSFNERDKTGWLIVRSFEILICDFDTDHMPWL